LSIFEKVPEAGSLADLSTLPRHVGIIMDGNGRWAKSRGMPRAYGHRAGVERLHDIVKATGDLGIEVLTVYAFSTENWKRPAAEVEGLMKLLIEFLYREIDQLVENGVRIVFSGDEAGVGETVQKAMAYAKDRTKDNHRTTFNVAFNYGGRQEILLAAKKLAAQAAAGTLCPEEITAERFAEELDTAGLPDLDLVIRTSGEQRLSNFMLYQSAYAEFVFVKEHWPDFDERAYLRAIGEFQRRGRRFGGL